MARQPNSSPGEADGIWDVTRPNQQRNAAYGERWPDPYVPPPNYGDGYTSRVHNISGGNSQSLNAINDWGSFSPSQNNYFALQMRCTTNDWQLTGLSIGGAFVRGGTMYYHFKLWEGGYVNPQPGTGTEIGAYNQGPTTVYIPTSSRPAPSTWLSLWGTWGAAGLRLTQNTWYTVGFAFTQSHVQNHHALPCYWLQGQGYGNIQNSETMTCSATNAAGTTNVTSTFEWQNNSGNGTGTAPFVSEFAITQQWNGGSYCLLGVRVFV